MDQEVWKYEQHNFQKMKSLPWSRCVHCGLLSLNNQLTEWSIKKGCNYKDLPNYPSVVKKFTKLF